MTQTSLIDKIRQQRPTVVTLSNVPTMADVENVVHAIGAQPMTSQSIHEIKTIIGMADALTINIGALDDSKGDLISAALDLSDDLAIPVVLDCDGAFIPYRQEFVEGLLDHHRFTLIRGNNREIATLAGADWQNHGNSAVTINNPDDIWGMAENCVKKFHTMTAITGQTDVVSDGQNAQVNSLGTSFFRSYVGSGDMVSSLVAAFLAVRGDADTFDTVVHGLEFFSAAGQLAASEMRSRHPGTFFVKLLDNLSTITFENINQLHTDY